MSSASTPIWTDWLVVLFANFANLALAVMFLARVRHDAAMSRGWGLAAITLSLLLLVGVAGNLLLRRAWWQVVLPLPFILVSLITLLLDFIYKVDFRSTVWVGPYLGLFYLGQMVLIGYAFTTSRLAGGVTLVTYFLCLAASLFAYFRVGHGV